MVVKGFDVTINICTTNSQQDDFLLTLPGVHVTFIKHFTFLIALSISLFSAPLTAQNLSDATIEKRIMPIGDAYLDGEISSINVSKSATEPSGPRSAEKVYNTYCVACHSTGAAGAPIKDDTAAWAPRIAQGEATLIKHAIEGFNAMPAKGTCGDCSDDEIINTVQFLTTGL